MVEDVGIGEEVAFEMSLDFPIDGSVRWGLIVTDPGQVSSDLENRVDEFCHSIRFVDRFGGGESFMQFGNAVVGGCFVVVTKSFPSIQAGGGLIAAGVEEVLSLALTVKD